MAPTARDCAGSLFVIFPYHLTRGGTVSEYYDWILVAIAAALASGFVVGLATAVPMEMAMAGSVLVATPFVYEAIFRNPPIPENDARRTVAAIVWHVLLVWVLLEAVL